MRIEAPCPPGIDQGTEPCKINSECFNLAGIMPSYDRLVDSKIIGFPGLQLHLSPGSMVGQNPRGCVSAKSSMLCKQCSANPACKTWVTDTIFSATDKPPAT